MVKTQLIIANNILGKVAEWSNALVLKTSVQQCTVSSNLTLSAKIIGSSRGRTPGFGPGNGGSNPSPITK